MHNINNSLLALYLRIVIYRQIIGRQTFRNCHLPFIWLRPQKLLVHFYRLYIIKIQIMQKDESFKIEVFHKDYAENIMQFQVKMALQTQNLNLNSELVLNSVKYLYDHPEYGFFILKFNQNQPIGSLLLTFQNQQSWWMESVYIEQKYRKQGHFKSLFQEAVKIGKQKGCHSIQLYTQDENQKAKQTYRKLGMFQNGFKFYTYDFVYGKSEVKKQNIQKSQNFQICECQSQQQKPQFAKILSQTGKNINKRLKILSQNQIVGHVKFFTQFSDWRFGMIYYIDHLQVSQQVSKDKQKLNELHKHLSNYFKKHCQISVGALRYLFRPEDKHIVGLIQGGQVQHYTVMQIKF